MEICHKYISKSIKVASAHSQNCIINENNKVNINKIGKKQEVRLKKNYGRKIKEFVSKSILSAYAYESAINRGNGSKQNKIGNARSRSKNSIKNNMDKISMKLNIHGRKQKNNEPISSIRSYRYRSMDIDQRYTSLKSRRAHSRSNSNAEKDGKFSKRSPYEENSKQIFNLKIKTKSFNKSNNECQNKYNYKDIKDTIINSARQMYQNKFTTIQQPRILTYRHHKYTNKTKPENKGNIDVKKRKRRILTQISAPNQQFVGRKPYLFQNEKEQYCNEEISSIIYHQNQLQNEIKCEGNLNRSCIEQYSILENIKQIDYMLADHKNKENINNENKKQSELLLNSERHKQTVMKPSNRRFRTLTHESQSNEQQNQLAITKRLDKPSTSNHAQSLPTLQSIQLIMNQNSNKKKGRHPHKYNSIIMKSIDRLKHIFPKGFFQDAIENEIN